MRKRKNYTKRLRNADYLVDFISPDEDDLDGVDNELITAFERTNVPERELKMIKRQIKEF